MTARSPEEVDALFEKALNAGDLEGKPQIDLKVERTVRSGKDLAATYGVWAMKTGDQEMSGKTIEVVRRQPDGSWLFVIDDPFARSP